MVRVTTDDGREGFGQVAPFNADITSLVLHRQIAPHVLGKTIESPADLEAISDCCIDANLKFPWSYTCRALAGVDTAIWDLLAREADMSVAELLGGTRRELAAYGSSMSRSITPEDEAARLARLRDEQGFSAFKIRVGKPAGHDCDAWPGRSEAIVPAVRQAVGDNVRLLVDANSCYTPPRAIEVGHMLEDHGVIHFEEPCPYWELEWTAEVNAALDLDVAGGEQDNDLAQWRRMIRMDAVDIVQPDVCYVGGITRALRVARMAADAGKPCVPHSANLSMVTLFALHMMLAIENRGPYLEFCIEDTAWAADLFEPAMKVVDGCAAITGEPGWGVRINQAWLDQAERAVSAVEG